MANEIGRALKMYAENVMLLREARIALATHPKLRVSISDVDSGLTRLNIILAVGSVEAALKFWGEQDFAEPYAGRPSKLDRRSNDERIRAMGEHLKQAGAEVERDILRDYLAMKYLRNQFVHSEVLSDTQRQCVLESSFPLEATALTENHWRRVISVVDALLVAMHEATFLTSLMTSDYMRKSLSAADLSNAYRGRDERLSHSLVRPAELHRLCAANLEKIADWLGFSGDKFPDRPDALLGQIALESWSVLWNHWLTMLRVDQGELIEVVKTFEALYRQRAFPISGFFSFSAKMVLDKPEAVQIWAVKQVPSRCVEFENLVRVASQFESELRPDQRLWDPTIPESVATAWVALFIPTTTITPSSIVRALRIGATVHDLVGQSPPVSSLFLSLLPKCSPQLTREFAEEARRAVLIWKLSTIWYAYVELGEDTAECRPWAIFDEALSCAST